MVGRRVLASHGVYWHLPTHGVYWHLPTHGGTPPYPRWYTSLPTVVHLPTHGGKPLISPGG